MAFEALELVCGCCELCLYIGDALGGGTKKKEEERAVQAPQTSRVVRMSREDKRGVRISFEKKHVSEIEFLAGPHAGKRASALTDMELKRLAHLMPHRTARFAIRRYLRNRKSGRVAAAESLVIKR
jgi:hypothetical protein